MTHPEHDPERFFALHRLAAARIPATRVHEHLRKINGQTEHLLQLDPTLNWTTRQRERVESMSAATSQYSAVIANAARRRVHVVCATDPDYPEALRPYEDSPAILFVRGCLPTDRRGIAVVGSRRPDPYGIRQARRFASAFVEQGWVLVSGGASGIDAEAHSAALDLGGTTIAVLGCGLDIDYPASNRPLFQRIVEGGGCLISEMPLGTKPEPWLFPARNRIIAAWAEITIVVEAPRDSGALITARNAAEYGKDVFVVPGPVDTGRSTGGHHLIRDGAGIADCPEDIPGLQSETPSAPCAPSIGGPASSQVFSSLFDGPPARSVSERLLLQSMDREPRPLEVLAGASGLSPSEAGIAATLLEMQGLLQRYPGNRFALAGTNPQRPSSERPAV